MKEREIDWSKAPAGATHFGPENEEWHEAWYKLDGDEWFDMLTSNDDQWDLAPAIDEERVSQMIQRPAEWNGTGLPPVGAVCEVEFSSGWKKVTVLAHAKGAQGQTDALFAYTRQSGAADWSWTSNAGKFRPIRTPEQIAAEQRKRAIDAPSSVLLLRSGC